MRLIGRREETRPGKESGPVDSEAGISNVQVGGVLPNMLCSG